MMTRKIVVVLFALALISCSAHSQSGNEPAPYFQVVTPTTIVSTPTQQGAYPYQTNQSPIYPYSVPQSPTSDTTSITTTIVTLPSIKETITVTTARITKPTPEFAQRVPTTNPKVLQSTNQTIQTALLKSEWYIEHAKDDVILSIIPIETSTYPSIFHVVVFWVDIYTTKDRQQSIEFAPLTASMLIYNGSVYQETWNTKQWIEGAYLENPFWKNGAYDGWYQQRYIVQDITGDGQPEVILSGCAGFGQACGYALGVWSLTGAQLFSTTSIPEGMGATISRDKHTIIVRNGLTYRQYNPAEMQPSEIELIFFTWDNDTFTKTKTEQLPFTEWDEPKPENL